MGRSTKTKSESKPLFPENIEWWNSPGKKNDNIAPVANGNGNSNGNPSNHNDDYATYAKEYGAITTEAISSYEPLVGDDDYDDDDDNNNNNPNNDDKDEEEAGEASFLIDKVILPIDVPFPVEDLTTTKAPSQSDELTLFGQLDVQSDISNSHNSNTHHSSSSSNVSGSGSGSSYTSTSSNYQDNYDFDIEQPHRTLGLICFDFLRFVAISANVRMINTQMVPVFLAWGRGMELLHVALRVLMTMFSLLLILVEFPDLFPFLQHSIITTTTTTTNDNTSLSDSPPPQTSTTTIIPPLYITNWIPRGVFYIFLSIICFEQSIVVRAIDEERHASTSSRFFDGIFIVVSGWCMMLVGVIYTTFGIFCVQKIMERVRIDEKIKWNEYYEQVHRLELEQEEAEEREWLLENGKIHEIDNVAHNCDDDVDEDEVGDHIKAEIHKRRCCSRVVRWRRRCHRRRARGQGGFFYQMGCRTVDWRC